MLCSFCCLLFLRLSAFPPPVGDGIVLPGARFWRCLAAEGGGDLAEILSQCGGSAAASNRSPCSLWGTVRPGSPAVAASPGGLSVGCKCCRRVSLPVVEQRLQPLVCSPLGRAQLPAVGCKPSLSAGRCGLGTGGLSCRIGSAQLGSWKRTENLHAVFSVS